MTVCGFTMTSAAAHLDQKRRRTIQNARSVAVYTASLQEWSADSANPMDTGPQ
jgi:3-mercaptopyruvate sulfurtransferase SseA